MPYCGTHSAVKAHDHATRTVSRLSCRSWTCDECRPHRRRRLISEILGGNPTSFLTLTIRPEDDETPIQATRRLNKAWRELRAWLCDHHRWRKLDHYTVVEKHASGFPHLHIFLRAGYIHWERIADYWELITGSRHIWITKLDNPGRGARYAAKYAGKACDRIGTAKRYYRSQSWELRQDRRNQRDRPRPLWVERVGGSHHRVAHSYRVAGWTAEPIHDFGYIVRAPP